MYVCTCATHTYIYIFRETVFSVLWTIYSQQLISPFAENLAEEPDAVSDQIKSLSPEEERFWETLVARLIGKDVNLGLGIEELVRGLRKLRFRIVVIVMITNLAWIIALSFFYLWSFSSGSQISAYGILSGVLYAFSFFIQIVGMTIYRVQDGVHRIGKIIYGKDLAHYVRSRDER